jgi:putative transposase
VPEPLRDSWRLWRRTRSWPLSAPDSYDNALAESFHGLNKWELIYRHGPWRGLDDMEFATLSHIDWFNHLRLHGPITDGPGSTTPAAYEADHYPQQVIADPAVTQ